MALFLKDCPRALVTRVTDKMRSSSEENNKNTLFEKSTSGNTKYHNVHSGDNVNICRCTCKESRKTRMLCKRN